MGRRRIAAFLVPIVSLAALAMMPGPVLAGRCDGHAPRVPPEPNPPQTTTALTIAGGYYGLGGPGPLDGLGCTGGVDLADTNILPPRADFAVVVLSTKCDKGAVLPSAGSSLVGLGVSYKSLTLKCGAPDNLGKTSYVSDLFPLKPNKSGTLTATVKLKGVTYTSTSRAALPVDQPA